MVNKKVINLVIALCFIFTAWQWISAEVFAQNVTAESRKTNMGYNQEILSQFSSDIADRYNVAFQRIVIVDGLILASIFLILRGPKQ